MTANTGGKNGTWHHFTLQRLNSADWWRIRVKTVRTAVCVIEYLCTKKCTALPTLICAVLMCEPGPGGLGLRLGFHSCVSVTVLSFKSALVCLLCVPFHVLVHFLLFVVTLVVSNRAVDRQERLVSEVNYYVLRGMFKSLRWQITINQFLRLQKIHKLNTCSYDVDVIKHKKLLYNLSPQRLRQDF